MPNVGTITGSMYLDPSAYISGLNSAAGATQQFQRGVSTVSFAGFNRGIFATTTLLYGLARIMSGMSKGMEEYANMLGRIGTVADLTAASVSALADSMKQISVYQGVSRKDIMGGMYTAAQAGYQTPAEMRGMAAAGARLSRASGKEIDVKKSVDLQSGIRQALGIGMDAVSSNRMNDILLKGRDIGRWELDQMAHALGIPLTVWGNQFAGKQDGEETLRQLLAVMSVASLAGVSPNMTATGTRRIVEKTVTLANSGKKGDPLRKALRGVGFTGQDPIMDALNEGGMKYLNTLMGVSNNGETSELNRLGYGARDLLVLTSALRGKGQKLNEAYEELSYGNVAGTTDRYGDKMRQTYDYSRDRLRSEWQITSQEFMKATIPLIGQFVNMLEALNRVAQSIPDSVKSFMLLMGAMAVARLALNFAGFRSGVQGSSGGMAGRGITGFVPLGAGGFSGTNQLGTRFTRANMSYGPAAGTDVQAERLARRQAAAASRSASYSAGFGGPSGLWPSNVGMPWATSHTPFKPMMWNEISQLDRGSGGGFGPVWYDSRRQEPMNYYQHANMSATSSKYDALRDANNRKFWAPNGNPWIRPRGGQTTLTMDREQQMLNMAALGQRFLPGQIPGSQFTSNGYGPSAQARIRWAAYKQGSSVNFDTGAYGSLTPAAQGYANRGSWRVAPASVAVWRQMQAELNKTSEYANYLRSFPGTIPGANGSIMGRMRSRFAEDPTTLFGGRSIAGRAIGPSAMGNVIPAITSFGSAIGQVLGPLIRFGAILGVATKILEGWNYKPGSGEEKVGGLTRAKEGGRSPSLLDTIGHGYSMFGSFLRNGRAYIGDMTNDYAEEHGYTADDGNGRSLPKLSLGQNIAVHSNLLGYSAYKIARYRAGASPIGLAGYRKQNANDAMGKLARERFSHGTVRNLSKGGIDFNNFKTAEPYMKKYLTEQLGEAVPKNWDNWFQTNMKDNVQKLEDAMKFYADVIRRNALNTQAAKDGASWSAPWSASVSQMTVDAVARQRILSGRQWDIYSGADYSGRGNGGLNWNAGGKDYKAMYAAEMGNLDSRFGGFTDQSYSANARGAIDIQRKMWEEKAARAGGTHSRSIPGKDNGFGFKAGKASTGLFAGAQFGGLTEDPGLSMMLREGDEDFAKMKRYKEVLRQMPNIGTMSEAEQMALFTKMSGRDLKSDVYAKADFDNFRNFDMSKIATVEQVKPPVQYASATQFGTAEAYNQLLTRPDASEKMSIAVDKWIAYADGQSVKKADVEAELQKVIKAAVKFFEQDSVSDIGKNLELLAVEAMT